MEPTLIMTEAYFWNGSKWVTEYPDAAKCHGCNFGHDLYKALSKREGMQVYLVKNYGSDQEEWQAV